MRWPRHLQIRFKQKSPHRIQVACLSCRLPPITNMKCKSPLHLILMTMQITHRVQRITDPLVRGRAFLLRGQREPPRIKKASPKFWTISRSPSRRNLSWLRPSLSSIGKPPFKMIWTLNCRENSSDDLTQPIRNWRIWQISRTSCLRLLETEAKDGVIEMQAVLDPQIEETALLKINRLPGMQASLISMTAGKTNQRIKLSKSKSK